MNCGAMRERRFDHGWRSQVYREADPHAPWVAKAFCCKPISEARFNSRGGCLNLYQLPTGFFQRGLRG
jgi:hypothetical protein